MKCNYYIVTGIVTCIQILHTQGAVNTRDLVKCILDNNSRGINNGLLPLSHDSCNVHLFFVIQMTYSTYCAKCMYRLSFSLKKR